MDQTELIAYFCSQDASQEEIVTGLIQSAVESVALELSQGRLIELCGLGSLCVKNLPGWKTVIFTPEREEADYTGVRVPDFSSGNRSSEKKREILSEIILTALSENSEVFFSQLGTFRSQPTGTGTFRISFLPSVDLRRLLSGSAPGSKKARSFSSPVEYGEVEGKQEEFVKKQQEIEVSEKTQKPEDHTLQEVREILEKSSDGDETGIEMNVSEGMQKKEKKNATKTSRIGDMVIPMIEDSFQKKRSLIQIGIVVFSVIVFICFSFMIFRRAGESVEAANELPASLPQHAKVNLLQVAQESYGNPVFWIYLYDANRDKLSSPLSVILKSELKVPDLKEEYNIDTADTLEVQRAKVAAEMILKQYK